MDERSIKRKAQLLEYEQRVVKERSLYKLLGQKLPEEAIKPPKIGEWCLSQKDPLETSSIKSGEIYLNNFKHMPTTKKNVRVPKYLTASYQKPRSKSRVVAPFIAKPPRVVDSPFGEVAHHVYPTGTVTTNLNCILKSKYKDPMRPLPPLPKVEDDNTEPQFLPLELFDDKNYEEYPIEELMKNPIAYSRFQEISGENYWAKCTVLNYDDNTGLFLIEWDSTLRRKKVARFNLRFEKEDPEKFKIRVEHAKKMCAEAENIMKFDSRVANMATDKLPTLSPDNINSIHLKLNMDLNEKDMGRLRTLDEEICNEFMFINNKEEFLSELDANPLIPNRNEFLALKPPPPSIPPNGLVEHVHFDFDYLLNEISENLLMSQSSILKGILTIWCIFQDSVSLSLLNEKYDNLVSLDEFVKLENNHLNETAMKFKKQIQNTLEGVMGNADPDKTSVLKDKTKFTNMVNLTTQMLHTVLLTIVKSTLTNYTSLFNKYIPKNNSTDYIKMYAPQFSSSLILVDKKLNFDPSITKFKEEFIKILDNLEKVVNDIPIIKSALIEVDSSCVSFTDCCELIRKEKTKLSESLDQILQKLKDFLTENESIEWVLNLNPVQYAANFDVNGKRTLNEYRNQLTEFNKVLQIIQTKIKSSYNLGAFYVSCEQFKIDKTAQIKELIFQFLSRIKRLAIDGITELKNEFDTIEVTLKKTPNTPEELAGMKKYLEHVYESEKERSKKMSIANERFSFLEDFHFEITNEEINFHYNIRQMPQKIGASLDETERTLSIERIRMVRELRTNQEKLEQETVNLADVLAAFASKYTELDMSIEAVDQINDIGSKLNQIKEQHETYSNHEKLFDFEQGVCKPLQKLIEDFTPLSILWNLASDWNNTLTSWMDTQFSQIRADAISQFMSTAFKKVTKLKKELANQPALIKNVLTPLSTQLEGFKRHVPLITKLRNQGLKRQHWEQISNVVGFTIEPTQELTLQNFIDLNLERWNDKVSEIASIAANEYSIELSLDQMDMEVQQKKFSTVEFRDTKQYILNEIDDITSLIDDHLITTQTLLTSPFILPNKERATEKLNYLKLCSQTMDEWITCQKSWLYLQPIFSGTSIQQKLHKEAAAWGEVDKSWNIIMNMTHDHPDFNNTMHREILLPSLKLANEKLETITHGLNAYLESKRLGFPRFFFLSNDELISILSHTKDFSKIQDSMQKLFEYVNSITVTEDNEITHMNDSTGEVIKLSEPVDGNTPEIEDWLNRFEEEMKASIKDLVSDSIDAYPKKKREYWISDFPSQVILMTNQIMWTQQVSQVLSTQKPRGLKILQTKFVDALDQLTSYVRQPISKQVRQVVSSMLIFEVHNRDVIADLIESEANSLDSFKWQQQLRYYWEDETIIVKSINNNYEYSYEYAGNSSRLVITPLTDRCYQTLLSAFKQNLSGAPSGPAGTGKTETVRDCAKALGRPCVVYNCSEEVTPEQMSQFFAGLSSSGSWSCFDEFNRINIEVLSVIAQQVRTIQSAISENADYFQLDNRRLKLNTNAAICITMNPGYAGRTELPDNLKAVFRPCAMMVPDFVFISEILLFSGGFKNATMLAVKLVALFDLCRKQLSNAHHYDWGLRAMRAILSTAGKSKRNDLEADESALLVSVIRDCTAPRLVSSDIPLFIGIIHDVFPGIPTTKQKNGPLVSCITSAFDEMNICPIRACTDKCIELYETTLVRHGIMLVGGSFGGKTTSYKVLARALTILAEKGDGKPVKYDRLNPKSISIAELYGSFNPVTSEWSDGVLSKSIRQASFSDQSELKWIVVDGPVDSLWIETMNSLLDENKVLCLPNNERIQLGPHVKMVFEVDNLREASPATVSRCGMIYYDPSVMPWKVLTDSWCAKYQNELEPVIKKARLIFEDFIPKLIQFIDIDARCAVNINPNYCVSYLLQLLDCFHPLLRKQVDSIVDGDEIVKKDPLNYELYCSLFSQCEDIMIYSEEQYTAVFERAFLFSAVWAFGGCLIKESRLVFDKFFKDLMVKNSVRFPFPQEGTVFDYFADWGKGEWSPWVDNNVNMNLTKDLPIEKQLYPTKEASSALYFSRLLITHNRSILLQGADSSKTLVAKTLLSSVLDAQSYDTHVISLSPASTPNNISKYMLQFMHKKQGTYGPLPNQSIVFLIDNLGSVKPEIYGAQPPLELIRQFFDQGGWFNTSPVEFLNIIGTSILGTTGQAGGGMHEIPDRLVRHFFFLHLTRYEIKTIEDIAYYLMNMNLSEVSTPIKEQFRTAAHALITIYEQCQLKLLPIPSKLHYVFNLRNIVHVIRGIALVDQQNLKTEEQFQKLWHHEMSREFTDRFNTINDRKWFESELNRVFAKEFKVQWSTLYKGEIMFNTFDDNAQKYKECIKTPEQLLQSCNALLDEHNHDASKPIEIVLFQEAISHLSALSRVFATQRGHSMLVGVKASGRKSLTRLALYSSTIEPFEIAITRTYGFNEWREDMKTLIKQCTLEDTPTGFIITDSQIIIPQQLEDISNLLINSEIPQLFERDEIEGIKAELASKDTGLSLQQVDYWAQFIEKVRKNLHIILIFSPYSASFKDAMLAYPAIRNETTIDWYMPWSQNALESVASVSFKKQQAIEQEKIPSIVNVIVQIHKYMEDISVKFMKNTKRFTAITPSKYFEMLNMFSTKLAQKKQAQLEQITKYENGVEKIMSTREQINIMYHQLDMDIPVLQKTRKECEEMLKALHVKSAEVEEKRKEVDGQRIIAEKEAAAAAETNRVAQEHFEKAQPILEKAQNAVMRLDKDSLSYVKTLHNPNAGMKDTYEAVCIIFGRGPRKVNGPTPGTKIEDYWPEFVSILIEVGFIKTITSFKIEDIKKETIVKLKKYVPELPEQREEKKLVAQNSCTAIGALYDWVCAAYDYWHVFQQILPLKNAADEAAKKLADSKAVLAKAQQYLSEVEKKLENLSNSVKAMKEKEADLAQKVSNTKARLERAEKIMDGLSGESTRWEETAKNLKENSRYILGNTILISGVLIYIGAFSPMYRQEILTEWKGFLKGQDIPYSSDFSITAALGNDGTIRDWIVKGLPNDTHSIENALIITNNNESFPLLIDPQLSGTKWIRAVYGDQIKVLQFDQPDFLRQLKGCVTCGIPVIIENAGLKLDPLLDPILSREIHTVDGMKRVNLGGESVTYVDSFRLFISTKYPNPQYSPEVCSQVTLINFTTTQFGLTDLLLNNLIEVEREDLDTKRIEIMEASASNTKKLAKIEIDILNIVSNAGSDILDDDNAIFTLQKAQATSKDIEEQMKASQITENQINEFKKLYSPVAERAALLYFCIADFSVIDPMYQFSMKWFVNLFRKAISKVPLLDDDNEKIKQFHKQIAITFYDSVSLSLFSCHKLLFSTLMAIRIGLSTKEISGSELAFMLSPPVSKEPNPTNFFPDDVWASASLLMQANPVFDDIVKSFEENAEEWANYMNLDEPEKATIPYNKELTPFQKLLVLRIFHLQKVQDGLHIFIGECMGPEFVTPPSLKLLNAFENSDALSPLIFIIVPGIDPQDEILSVAKSMDVDKSFKSYSLGRGRGQGAEELVKDAAVSGYWVLLQNCHLSLSWMPKLENIINNLNPEEVNPKFRLCLVTMSSPDFPIGILYQGTKLIYEIPKGIRENVIRIYNNFNAEEYDENQNVIEKKLAFHLAFFHAVVLERLQFGSIGWNIPYEFNPSDYNISLRHLKIFLNEAISDEIPFEALSYVIGELNYGGRVTDKLDRRLLLSLLRRFFSEDIESPTFTFGDRYKTPNFSDTIASLTNTIFNWPVVTAGIDVGLSENASTIIARNEARSIFSNIIEVQPTLVASTDSISEEQFALNLISSLIERVPKKFNVFQFKSKFDLSKMMSTVLYHEISFYNELIQVIGDSLLEMQNGLKGLTIVDEKLERFIKKLLANKIPDLWLEYSFPSILSLNNYMDDLNSRVSFLDNWVKMGAPVVYKLGAFYHPEEFLTAILQLYSRNHNVPFDTLSWKTSLLDVMTPDRIASEPEEGIYIEGLPLEGAKWDLENHCLAECSHMELVNILPVIHLCPTQETNIYDMNETYECPVFRTQNRGTGAMDLPNYIISIYLPSSNIPPDHWIQRSVAAFITTQ